MTRTPRALIACSVVVAATAAGVAAADGGPGVETIASGLNEPRTVVPATGGGYLVADTKNHRIRRIAPDGTIVTVAGTGSSGSSGDGGSATAARLNEPAGVAPAADGGFLIADTKNHRIRKVSAGGTITTVAGTGSGGFDTDAARGALSSAIKEPAGVVATTNGFLFTDTGNSRVRQVAGGVMTTLADAGDVKDPTGIALGPNGLVVVADTGNHTVVSISGGVATRIAGTGSGGSGGDGPALSIPLDDPQGVATLPGGGYLVADTKNHVIRTIIGGVSRIVAGTRGQSGTSSDAAGIAGPFDEPGAAVPIGGRDLVLADTKSDRIRLVHGVLPFTSNASPPAPGGTPPSASPAPGGSAPADPKTTTDPEAGESPSELGPAAPPAVGERVTTDVARGTVRVRLPGSDDYVPLEDASSLRVGAIVDATKGAVRLTSASNGAGDTQTATFSHGRFRIEQTGGSRPTTELVLAGPAPVCARPGGATTSAKRSTRRLWGDGKGRFRTRGRHSAATVRGTRWLVEDRCGSTVTRVVHGVVAVRDSAKRTTTVLRAGGRYVARRAPAKR